MLRFLGCCVIVSLLAPAALAAAPENAGEDSPAPAGALSDIAKSLQHLEALLRTAMAMQRMDLSLRRAELAIADVVPLQTALREARAARDNDEAQVATAEQGMKRLKDRLDERAGQPEDDEARGMEDVVRELEVQTQVMKSQLGTLRARIAELDNEVSRKTAERDQVLAEIDRALSRLATP
jgi:chromosome segregation ATPase